MHLKIYWLFLFFILIPIFGFSQNEKKQAIELGEVQWYRDYNEAIIDAKIQNKPILILFQEIPGCSTCRNYGQNILSHPLLVDAIQNEFIPLAIYNNKPGKDSQILKKYKEPSWNNPVVRIINHNEFELTDRLSGDYTKSGLALKMKLALLRSHGKVPSYFNIIADELVAEDAGLQTTYYKMFCFWTGEAHLGQLPGVINTTPGFMSCGEVVQVNYDPQLIDEKELDKYATNNKFKTVNSSSRFRKDIDPQYYLKKSSYRFLPMTPAQRTKINSAISQQSDPDIYLSPSQLKWKNKMDGSKNQAFDVIYYKDIDEAWSHAKSQLGN